MRWLESTTLASAQERGHFTSFGYRTMYANSKTKDVILINRAL